MGRQFPRKANKKLDEFDPLAGVDKDFIWDGTKQPKSVIAMKIKTNYNSKRYFFSLK